MIEEVDRGFVSMTWEAPHNDGGAKIAGYNVEKREPDMDWVQVRYYLSHHGCINDIHRVTKWIDSILLYNY